METKDKEQAPISDISKCCEEIKQLRNQQFILGTTAISIFGVYATVLPLLFDKNKPGTGTIAIFSAMAVLIVLLLLFFWSRQLRVLIGVISVWLELVGESKWEKDFRAYHNTHSTILHTKLVSWIFLLLGFAVPGLVIAINSNINCFNLSWLSASFIAVNSLYLAIVVGYGFYKIGINEKRIKQNWINIKKEDDLSDIDRDTKSTAESSFSNFKIKSSLFSLLTKENGSVKRQLDRNSWSLYWKNNSSQIIGLFILSLLIMITAFVFVSNDTKSLVLIASSLLGLYCFYVFYSFYLIGINSFSDNQRSSFIKILKNAPQNRYSMPSILMVFLMIQYPIIYSCLLLNIWLSCFFYYAENGKIINCYLDALSIVLMSTITIGIGDISQLTGFGKIIVIFSSLLGIFVISVVLVSCWYSIDFIFIRIGYFANKPFNRMHKLNVEPNRNKRSEPMHPVDREDHAPTDA